MTTLAPLWRSLLFVVIGSVHAVAADLLVIAPSAPGSGWDQLAQAMKVALTIQTPATNVRITNIPGGGGTVGLSRFLADPNQGDLLVTGLTMMDSTLLKQAPITLDRMVPVARLCNEPFLLVVPDASAWQTVGELTTAFRLDPAKVTWAGGPAGGIDHVATSLFARAADVDPAKLNYVPFLATGDAVAALSEGRVMAGLLSGAELAAAVTNRQLRVLGVASPDPVAWTPAPTLREGGVDLEFGNWRGLIARPGSSPAEQAAITALVARMADLPAWQDMIRAKGWVPAYLPSTDFAAFIKADHARVKGALKAAGILRAQAN